MAGKGDETTEAVERLYGLPLDEFTPARDALAKELKRGGDGDGAAAVKRLRKPSVAAWALNRVRRSHPSESDALLAAGERLRGAQQRLLSKGDREAFGEAIAQERRLVGELAGLAARELSAAGRAPSAAVEEKLRGTLHAVALDDEVREAFEEGRLVSDQEASGLGLPGGGAPPAGRAGTRSHPARKRAASPKSAVAAKPPASPKRAASRGADPQAAAKQRRAQAKAAALHEKRVGRLEERIEKARARAQERSREATEAEASRRDARDAATRAAAALERAEAAEERARARAVEADDYLAGLKDELRELRESAR